MNQVYVTGPSTQLGYGESEEVSAFEINLAEPTNKTDIVGHARRELQKQSPSVQCRQWSEKFGLWEKIVGDFLPNDHFLTIFQKNIVQ